MLTPSTPFQTEPYLSAYQRYFGRGKQFHRIDADEETAAFLMTNGCVLRRAQWWGAGIHDIGDGVYQSEISAQKLWQRIENFVYQHNGAHLAQIPANSPLISYAVQAKWQIWDAEVCPVLHLPNNWDEYLKMLGRNMRGQMRRYPKRLEKNFAVRYELATTENAVQLALSNLFRLHGKRWRARGQTGVLATPRRQRFHRDVCRTFLQHNWLRLWTLYCNDKPVCVLLNYYYQKKYFFFIGGFDPDWGRWSVGTCLFAHIIKTAISEGSQFFDFLRGAEIYKYRFGAIDHVYKTILWHEKSWRGKLLYQRMIFDRKLQRQIHRHFSAAAR